MIFRPTGIAGISPSFATILRRISGFAYRRHFRVVALLCCHVQAGPRGGSVGSVVGALFSLRGNSHLL